MSKITYYNGGAINLQQIIESDLFKNNEESIMLCDLTDVIIKYHLWRHLIPRVTPFYAVKCNDSYPILKILNDLQTGFDCASKDEIDKVLSLGCTPDRIIFAHTCKMESHLLYAKEKQIYTMTFDGEEELLKIKKYFPDSSLVLRFVCEAKKALSPLGKKFGCDPYSEAPNLMRLAKHLGLNIVGLSFHVGSDCLDFPIYEKAISIARTLTDMGNSMGFQMKILDIGGGFPGEHNSYFIEASKVVNAALDKYFPGDDILLIAEPGRFFVSSSNIVLCKIHSKRQIFDKNGNIQEIMYYLNDGAYGTFNQVLTFGDVYPVTPKLCKKQFNITKCPLYKTTFWGPTCDSTDLICKNMYFPNLNIGDPIVFEDLGAYTLPFRSSFNGFKISKIEYFINKQFKPSNEEDNMNPVRKTKCSDLRSICFINNSDTTLRELKLNSIHSL